MLSNTAAGTLAGGLVLAAFILSLALGQKPPAYDHPPVVQSLGDGRVFVMYLNTMLSCDADRCKRIGHMFDANLSAQAK